MNCQLESRVRENRMHGSEGGGTGKSTSSSYPYRGWYIEYDPAEMTGKIVLLSYKNATMTEEIRIPDDSFKIRCPKLGHEIVFSYCRSEGGELPCRKILDCWYPYFEIEIYFRKRLTAEEWRALFESPPPPKMLTLLELIEQAKKRQKDKEHE